MLDIMTLEEAKGITVPLVRGYLERTYPKGHDGDCFSLNSETAAFIDLKSHSLAEAVCLICEAEGNRPQRTLRRIRWQSERPTTGMWWLAIHPKLRGCDYYLGPVPMFFNNGVPWTDGPLGKPIPSDMLVNALYYPRETLSDPFFDSDTDDSVCR